VDEYEPNGRIKAVYVYQDGRPLKYSLPTKEGFSEIPSGQWPWSFARAKPEMKRNLDLARAGK